MSDAKKSAEVTREEDLVLIDERENYAILTLNRPEKRNAMSLAAVSRLRQALEQVRDKHAVILTGVGNSFCAGMDLKEQVARIGEDRTSQEVHVWTTVQAEIRKHPAIFIAAVNGFALGGGSTLIHTCDLAIAAESAQIGAPEMGFGGFPSQAGPSAVKRVAPKHAAEIIFLARKLSAQDAFRMAIVNKVVPDAELLKEATDWAEQLASFNPIALDWGKRSVQHMENLSWDDAMDYTNLTNAVAMAKSNRAREGITAFLGGQRGVGQGV
jgi:enoyl-CoA hydratase/carnithine racemase